MEGLLCNKYKPTNMNDLIFDNDFINLLRNLIETETLNVIISGNTASGKTSIVNLLIKEYYKDTSKGNSNIIYVHETKDQGIHYFRNDLHLFCKTCCTVNNKKKMVILDDFDLINDQSQQVFRNLLDMYSNNVIFLMTCTNIHKIINSIQSRQLIINIPHPNYDMLYKLCNNIIKDENILIDDNLLKHIIDNSSYSIIKILNYLQKCKLINKPLTINNSDDVLTHVNFKILDDYINKLKEKNIYESYNILNNLVDYGYSVIDILDSLYIYLKNESKILNDIEKYKIISCVCKYITIFYDLHENNIELIFLNNSIYKVLNNLS